jgi:M6 family metalloprotease-like protein
VIRHPIPSGLVQRAALAALAALALTRPLAGQDVEALSALRGIPLPAAYYDTLRERPDAFELPNGLFRRSPSGQAQVTAVEGDARLPVVLALFADSRAPHISPDAVRASLFKGPAASGTVTALYEEMSGGRFRLSGDVLPWVRTSITMAEAVGDSYGLGGTGRVGAYLLEALALADELVDFALFDNDGPDGIPNSGDDDGVVDAVAFEFLEVAASCGGPAIWPHRSGIANWNNGAPYFSDDLAADGVPIMVNGYIIQSVADCTGTVVQTAATIAHEYGHVLGLPDFYHAIGGPLPENRRWVLGCWELMAAGAWGCGPVTTRVAFGPTHMMAPQKAELGWVELEEVGEVWDEEYILEPVQTSRRALLVPLDADGLEALIIEYRARSGFDEALPAAGVLITHRDLGGVPRPREGFRYRMRLVEADGDQALIRSHAEGGDRGVAGDAFAVDGATGKLHAFTTPALLSNETGGPTATTIHSIRVSDGRAYVRLSTGDAPRVVTPAETLSGSVARPLAEGLTLAGGRMPYTVIEVGGAPEGVGVEAAGDELRLIGAPRETGAFQVAVRLGDSRGSAFEALLPLSVAEFFVEQERLLQPLLGNGEAPLSVEEQAHLDGLGNGNGVYDVGDVRAWLLRE